MLRWIDQLSGDPNGHGCLWPLNALDGPGFAVREAAYCAATTVPVEPLQWLAVEAICSRSARHCVCKSTVFLTLLRIAFIEATNSGNRVRKICSGAGSGLTGFGGGMKEAAVHGEHDGQEANRFAFSDPSAQSDFESGYRLEMRPPR